MPRRAAPLTPAADAAPMHPHYAAYYAVIAEIPRGAVATYGQIARLAGRPGRARQVGYALHALPPGSPIPWQRVVNAQGKISPRGVDFVRRHRLAFSHLCQFRLHDLLPGLWLR